VPRRQHGLIQQEITMQQFDPIKMLLIFSAGLFASGLVTMLIGIVFLIGRSMGKEVRTIAKQTRELAQKGIADEIAGLVGNASTLLNATSEMAKTNRGTGLMLIIFGFAQIALSAFLLTRFGLG
jgi:hypothetical protein